MKNNKEEMLFEMFDKNGKLKDKETVMKEFEQLYDSFDDSKEKGDDFMSLATDPDSLIDVESCLDTFNFLNRTIYITDEITQEIADSFYGLVKFWNMADTTDEIDPNDREPIKVYINTPGGDLNATFTIIDAIKMSLTPVHTIVTGTAYSGGFFIAIAGHQRFCTPNSSYLFHEGSLTDSGDAGKIRNRMSFYWKQLDRLKKIVLENTKITKDEYEKRQNEDWLLWGEEAIEYGIVDSILTTII